MKKTKNTKGITLIALVVTIVVLLILAGITIATLTGKEGIGEQAKGAKLKNEIAREKESISNAIATSLANNKGEKVKQSDLQNELDADNGEGKVEVSDGGDEWDILFKEKNRLYYVEKVTREITEGEITKDTNPGDITKGQNGKELDGKSENSAYEIASIEDLVQFSKMTNSGNDFAGKYVKLVRKLNFNSSFSYSEPENTTRFGDYNNDGITEGIKTELTKEDSKGFTVINKFSGTFLGQNNKISNIKIIDVPTTENKNMGFIRENNGTIRDLKLSGTTTVDMASGNRKMYCVGGACGSNRGTMQNIENNIQIKVNLQTQDGGIYVGGVTGGCTGNSDTKTEAIVENCINKANLSATGKRRL